MGLSSNMVWHQTDFDGLKAILTEKCFKCSYSLENIHWKSSHIQIAFPMLSFCDIPLSDMDDYLGKYGKYTIGIKRKWAEQHGFVPVWYQTEHSPSLIELMKQRDNLLKREWSNHDILLWSILSCIKNYQGDLKKYGFKSYRFYDEREIRYVPNYDILRKLGISPYLNSHQYIDYKSKNDNSLIPGITLPFSYKQIGYILISSQNQKKRVLELLKDNEVQNDVVIMSYNQIKEDIIGLCHNS